MLSGIAVVILVSCERLSLAHMPAMRDLFYTHARRPCDPILSGASHASGTSDANIMALATIAV
jgi:hypothetical protein